MAKAAAVDSLEEGLVRLAMAESAARLQETQQRSIDSPSSAKSANASADEYEIIIATCIVCLAAPKDTLLFPCKNLVRCWECIKAVMASSSRPQCPVCRSRIEDCVHGVFL
jgi:hypothetical protein